MIRTPLPYAYMHSIRRLRYWRDYLILEGITKLPPPLSEELDRLMEAFWIWEQTQEDIRAEAEWEADEQERLSRAIRNGKLLRLSLPKLKRD